MTGHGGWEAANGRFLAASLEWLRLVLRAHHEARESTVDISVDKVTAAAQEVADAEEISPPPALVVLAARLGLSRFERDTLLLCAAVELDPSIATLCALAHGDERMAYPTFALALAALPDPAWEAVSPYGGLRFWRLVDEPPQGVVSAALRADERVVNYLKGLGHLDHRLTPVVTRIPPDAGDGLPPSQQEVADQVVRHWQAGTGTGAVVQLAGPADDAKQLVTAHAAAACGLLAYRLPASLLPVRPVELDEVARLWQREAMLLPLALYVDVEETGENRAASTVAGFLDRVTCPTVVATREIRADLAHRSLVLDTCPPTPAERAAAWRGALGPGADIDGLAAQFALEVPAITEVAAEAGGDPAVAWRACRVRTRPRLASLAERLEPKAGWDDIVLTEQARRQLGEIAAQVRQRSTVFHEWGFGERITRGLGLSALFAGPSGTGKTMAAEVLAKQLALDLYRVDLSAVVSKYIGETEKNLRRLFDAAEGVILLFDEADAMFGKRSEVHDAHDRYANIEISYLLQRMESHPGLAILTTNLRTALDSAFLRRLRFVVEFAFPGPVERESMWRRAFPAKAPHAGLDFDRLAQLPVSGGMTRNIALNAAFLAAADGAQITMQTVLDAARSEFRKLELPVRERDFTWEGAR
ncbi:ATP-binding protein [Amycolatopsis panacis]|uniref:ATP-binding protein n=1 Tax=Amycolatopsis panacis TaxID=2340917 RepID=A0A419I3M9_9PSEU|nr:ATP-binding protein [Amycolatopsis panacis]RJQ84792.1 ATP-binding protein [Amycolatopsis panacis]